MISNNLTKRQRARAKSLAIILTLIFSIVTALTTECIVHRVKFYREYNVTATVPIKYRGTYIYKPVRDHNTLIKYQGYDIIKIGKHSYQNHVYKKHIPRMVRDRPFNGPWLDNIHMRISHIIPGSHHYVTISGFDYKRGTNRYFYKLASDDKKTGKKYGFAMPDTHTIMLGSHKAKYVSNRDFSRVYIKKLSNHY